MAQQLLAEAGTASRSSYSRDMPSLAKRHEVRTVVDACPSSDFPRTAVIIDYSWCTRLTHVYQGQRQGAHL